MACKACEERRRKLAKAAKALAEKLKLTKKGKAK